MFRRLAIIIGGLLAVYIAGFFLFVATLPSKPSAPLKADGIVALTGGDARLDAAVALLEGGTGKRLLITGANKILTKDHLKQLSNGGRRFDCCADMGYAAEDTYGNAEEAAEWAAQHRFRSLIVVTANYHMPRSIRFFRWVMPKMRLVAYPVEPQAAWWHPGMLHLLHNEYLKYMAAVVVTVVDPGPPDGKSRATS
ncbi:MAG: YdcF family protein [Alphaproteobacteria bacterium]|nr:YdcF family protein [Alphaproteobacteria bacterium]MBL6937475.1 YdcF family protein [Alphaproteobacteria bacterium]MBL7098813.1 YdcF family protein [Alphaproteobacteria bacterium]